MALATAPTVVETAIVVTDDPATDLTPAERRHFVALEKRIERGLVSFRDVGMALLEIRDKRLYRLDYSSFEAYCRGRWDIDRGRAYQLMGASQVVSALEDGLGNGTPVPLNESQARELVPLFNSDPEAMSRVWKTVTASDEPITAPRIREAVRAVTKPAAADRTGDLTVTDRLVAEVLKVTSMFRVWKASDPTNDERKRVKAALTGLNSAAGA